MKRIAQVVAAAAFVAGAVFGTAATMVESAPPDHTAASMTEYALIIA
ncbi:hypothetical protein [Kibdelosporangium aridum]|nr:hypothetical protein [Kibdelosporangium aridum]